MKVEKSKQSPQTLESLDASEISSLLKSGQLLMVNRNRKNGLIVYKQHYAEFAGPGAAVGGSYDLDCQKVVSVGNLSLVYPETSEERKDAYLIRLQWIRLTQQLANHENPLQRAHKTIDQFENFFNTEIIAQLPDEALALLVGVFPDTVRKSRE